MCLLVAAAASEPEANERGSSLIILVPRGRAPFGQHQESRPLAKSNTRSPRFTDFPSLCACSESSLTNLIGSGLNLLCLLSHSKTECRWTRPEVAILGADQKERGLWGRECSLISRRLHYRGLQSLFLTKRKELWLCANGRFRMRSGMRKELWLCANGNILGCAVIWRKELWLCVNG